MIIKGHVGYGSEIEGLPDWAADALSEVNFDWLDIEGGEMRLDASYLTPEALRALARLLEEGA